MEIIVLLSLVIFLIWACSARKDKKQPEGVVPMRPYVLLDGQLREVVHRKRMGGSVVCTVKPLEKGCPRARIIVPAEGNDITWLPKR